MSPFDDEVVVSGIGLLTAVGLDAEENWKSIKAAQSGIRQATVVPVQGLISDRAGELPEEWHRRRQRGLANGIDRCHAIAADGVREALADAKLPNDFYPRDRIGISLGTSLGGAASGEAFHRQWIEKGLRSANASLLRQYPLHSVADFIAAEFGVEGPRSIQSNACAAGAVAIAYGVELIRSGVSDVVLAGGVDPLAYLSFGGFSCLGALDPLQCAPYTRSGGLNLGEGAGILVMERRDAALLRGAQILAAVGGYGLSADAYHATAPDPTGRGALRAMLAALEMGGYAPGDVDYVNGHGTGTPANDSVETRAIRRLRETPPPPISSTKSMIGHTLGAAGAVEAATTVLAIRDQILPPTAVAASEAELPLGLDIVPGSARQDRIRVALSNSFAFGGNNASILLCSSDDVGRAEQRAPRRTVVISGVAAMAGHATDTEAVLAAVASGEPLYGRQRIDVERYGSYPSGEIPDANLKRGINPQHLRRIDSLGRRACVVVGDLLSSRGLTRSEAAATGLVFATGTGPISTVEAFQRELIETGTGNTRLFPNTVMNAAAGHVAILHHLQGPTATICAGGTSGVSALHFASRLIENGACDRIIVLSADEAPPAMLAGYARIPGFLSRSACEPFSNSGKVYSGASVAILLEANNVARRGDFIGRIEGFGLTGDSHGVATIDPAGLAWARSFGLALADASRSPEEIDLVIAASCGRREIDETELKAVRLAGLHGRPLSAPKAVLGDAGASSALLGLAQALDHGTRQGSTSLVSSYEVGGSYQALVVSTHDA